MAVHTWMVLWVAAKQLPITIYEDVSESDKKPDASVGGRAESPAPALKQRPREAMGSVANRRSSCGRGDAASLSNHRTDAHVS